MGGFNNSTTYSELLQPPTNDKCAKLKSGAPNIKQACNYYYCYYYYCASTIITILVFLLPYYILLLLLLPLLL